MKNKPLISFCIATYKRQFFLGKTVQSILNQGYENIEIIVSDNDPTGSAEIVVKSFKSKKIKYYKNKKNLGMVKNFNNAFSHAKGDFITFVADDDPVEKNMLDTLLKLYAEYPTADSFFGACNVYIQDDTTAKLYGLKKGITSLQSKIKKKDEISVYDKDNFLENFLNYKVLSYFLWSTGFVSKKLVKEIGGMPDYGSPFLTDYVYICLVGSLGKMVVINKPLGRQTLHYNNFGRTIENLSTLPDAVKGFHRKLNPFINRYKLKKSYENFITNWVVDDLVEVFTFSKKSETEIEKKLLFTVYTKISNQFPYFKKREFELMSKIYFPSIFIPYWKVVSRIKRKVNYLLFNH